MYNKESFKMPSYDTVLQEENRMFQRSQKRTWSESRGDKFCYNSPNKAFKSEHYVQNIGIVTPVPIKKESQSQFEKAYLATTVPKFINPKKELIQKHNMDTKSDSCAECDTLKLHAEYSVHSPSIISAGGDSSLDEDLEKTKKVIQHNFQQEQKGMSNIEFWKYLLTLQILMQQSAVQLQNMVTKPVEELVTHSLKLVELKKELEPHLDTLEKSMRVILNVLPHIEFVEIGSPENIFKVSQQAWEKAYSKTTIKDAALAFLECDLFIPKNIKLSSTAGRSSKSAISGTLKPIDSRILNALYYTLADRKRMPNIQRTQDNYLASPHFLTAKEQKLVRETLAQYFNQIRQKEKRKAIHQIKIEDPNTY